MILKTSLCERHGIPPIIQERLASARCSTSSNPLFHAIDNKHGKQRSSLVVCMASERRIARVSKQLEREIGALLQGDPVVQTAICPERKAGFDSSLSALASVTEVRLSSDLQVAKIYLSVYSDEEGKASALQGLSKLQGYVRTKLAGQMRLRMMPEIRFMNDDAAERGEQVLLLLERIKRQNAGEEDLPPIAMPPLPNSRPTASQQTPEPSMKEELTEDGFLDLGNGEESSEGFLLETEAALEEEEDEDDFEDDLDEDEFELEPAEATADVIDEYLAGREDSSEGLLELSQSNPASKSGKGGQKKSRRK